MTTTSECLLFVAPLAAQQLSNVAMVSSHGDRLSLPLAGRTVGLAKSLLRESLNIPYFADAIVNGTVATTTALLRAGDHLEFFKRAGIKGSGESTPEQAEAESLIYAYGLVGIADYVKQRGLSTNESIDLMVDMVQRWAFGRFGTPDKKSQRILTEITACLNDAQERRMNMPQLPRLSFTERNIIQALGDQTLTGETLAKIAGYPCNSNFRATLSTLVKRGMLTNDRPGYRRCQDKVRIE